MTWLCAVLGVFLLLSGGLHTADAIVLYAKNEALRLIFPEADVIDPQTLFLTGEQVTRIQKLARSRIESPLLTVHIGKKQGSILGYALLDIHTVRTQPEAVFVVLTPDGVVASILIVAFHEPQEYMPHERWQNQFVGKTLTPNLQVRRGIAPISGASLSANAMTEAVRRALAVYDVVLRQGGP